MELKRTIFLLLFFVIQISLFSQIKELNYPRLQIEVLQTIKEEPDTLFGGVYAKTLNGCIISNKSTIFIYRKKGVRLIYNELNKLVSIETWKANDLFTGYNVGDVLFNGEMEFKSKLFNGKLHYVLEENEMTYYCMKRSFKKGLVIKKIIYKTL